MKREKVLIVEDEWILYDGLASFIEEKGFEASPYIKSFDEAVRYIELEMPDMALLDINLQGEKDGIDLGALLSSKYNIPFVYLSAYMDDVTLKRAKRTNPKDFLIKTDSNVNKDQLIVTIQMKLSENNSSKRKGYKDGIFVYSDYIRNTSEFEPKKIRKKLLKLKEIVWIETDSSTRNYLIFHTERENYYYRSPLSKVIELLPSYFVMVNKSEIVNLKKIDGKVNSTSFKIGEKIFRITPDYSKKVNEELDSLFYD